MKQQEQASVRDCFAVGCRNKIVEVAWKGAKRARRDLEVLNVLATEDKIVSPKKGAVLRYGGGLVEDMFKMLPKSTRRVVIKGGNHAGFGDYGIQAYDGERTISLEDQQDQTTKHLVAFLKRVKRKK